MVYEGASCKNNYNLELFSKDNMSDRDLNTVELLNLSGSEYARDREGSEYV